MMTRHNDKLSAYLSTFRDVTEDEIKREALLESYKGRRFRLSTERILLAQPHERGNMSGTFIVAEIRYDGWLIMKRSHDDTGYTGAMPEHLIEVTDGDEH